MNILFLTATGVGGATVLGALLGFLFNKQSEKICNIILAFAAGVMFATSVFNLIIPALEGGTFLSVLLTVSGIIFGALCITFLDKLLLKVMLKSEKTINQKDELQNMMLFISAIAVHNLPEGIAAGVGFGTGNIVDALTVAGSIALQNIPEGMVIIAPMISLGIKRTKVFTVASLTGVIEIIGTVFGYYAICFSKTILPFALSFAGGTMIYVICSNMIPETHNTVNKKKFIIFFDNRFLFNDYFKQFTIKIIPIFFS